MKDTSIAEPSDSVNETTGLPWLKSWNGLYVFTVASFVLWFVLLLAITGFNK